MSHPIIPYKQLRLNWRALAFGLFGALLAVALYSGFYVLTPLDPCLMGLPACLLIGHAISLGALGKRHRFLADAATVLCCLAYVFGTLPIDLWRHFDRPFYTTIESVFKRLFFIFGQGREADSGAHFAEVVFSWISLGIGIINARTKNQ